LDKLSATLAHLVEPRWRVAPLPGAALEDFDLVDFDELLLILGEMFLLGLGCLKTAESPLRGRLRRLPELINRLLSVSEQLRFLVTIGWADKAPRRAWSLLALATFGIIIFPWGFR